ncbi:MAG: SLBB domain-containing protein [Oscillospiraceae bacterium]|jgi:ferredoxin|nr:SLBB domain-containing protein [Oscillospiraceae bacterium]
MKFKPSGGLNLYQHKEPAFSRDQRRLVSPKRIFIPIPDGKDVQKASAFIDEAEYIGVSNFEYPGAEHARFGQFRPSGAGQQGEDEIPYYDREKNAIVENIDFNDLVDVARKAFIIDESDGRSLYKKFLGFRERRVNCLVADAIDEEPYVSSKVNTLMKKGDQVADALSLAAGAFAAAKSFALCYSHIDDTKTIVPSSIGGMHIRKISGKYPVKNRIENYTGKKDICGFIGVQALVHLYRAVYFGKKQSTTIITVAGDCIGYPCNVEVPIGTPVQEALEFCGLIRDPSQVVIMGSMSGTSITNLQLPILHSTRSVIAFHVPAAGEEQPCINCGKCNQVCPAGLSPSFIYKYGKYGYFARAERLHPEKCIECACCSYICPAHLDLSYMVMQIKNRIAEKKPESVNP